MSNLYALTQELAVIHDRLEESGGELDPFIEEWLSQVEMSLQEKSVSIGKWVKNLNSDVESLDKEIERLQLKKRRRKNVIDRVKNYVEGCMKEAGLTKIDNPA